MTPPVFEEELWEFYEEDVYTSKTNNDSINLLETVEVNVYNPQQIEQCKRKIKSCQNCRGLCDGAWINKKKKVSLKEYFAEKEIKQLSHHTNHSGLPMWF